MNWGRIFHLRDGLDQTGLLIGHAGHYRDLNWVLEAGRYGVEPLDFSQSPEVWEERLMTMGSALKQMSGAFLFSSRLTRAVNPRLKPALAY